MAQRVYATPTDYADFVITTDLDDPAILKLCKRASIVIDGLTRLARYDVDTDGNPTDPDVSTAFTDATCAQVEWWDVKDGDVTGAEANEGAVKIGSVSLGTTSSRESGVSTRDGRVAPEAIEILRNAGLYGAAVTH